MMFLLQRCLGYFRLEVVDLDIGILDSITDERMFSFPYYYQFKVISFPFDEGAFDLHGV